MFPFVPGAQFEFPTDAHVIRSVHHHEGDEFAQFKVLRARPTGHGFDLVLVGHVTAGQSPSGRVILFPANTRPGETLEIRRTHHGSRGWVALATRPGAELPSMWQVPTPAA